MFMKARKKAESLGRMSGKRYKILFAGILAITVVHFVMQMSFIKIENSHSAELTARIEDLKSNDSSVETKQPDGKIVDIKPEEYEVRKVKVVTMPENVQPVTRRQPEIVPPPSRTQTKKKAVRETRAERLRRAEKFLTGV